MKNQSHESVMAEHAAYSRDKHRADADIARIRFKYSKKFEDYMEWKNAVRVAWAMRRIARNYKSAD